MESSPRHVVLYIVVFSWLVSNFTPPPPRFGLVGVPTQLTLVVGDLGVPGEANPTLFLLACTFWVWACHVAHNLNACIFLYEITILPI